MKSHYLILLLLLIQTLFISILTNSLLAKIITINNLEVTKVIDGDTIWVKDTNNKSFKIRLLGINAPEICTSPPEPYSYEAKYQLKNFLDKQTIYIKYDSSNKLDKYNRVLAHIYRKNDNLWINLELVKLGLSCVYIINSNILYLESLIRAENLVIPTKLNIWSHPKYSPISPEQAVNFINEYKLIIGKINEIIKTKNSYWLIFANTTPSSSTLNSSIPKKLPTNIAKLNKLLYTNNNTLAIKINIKLNLPPSDWNKYIGKTVRVRGYIEQHNTHFIPFISLKNINTIEIYELN